MTAAVPTPSGYSDDFLIKADKSPNTRGATVLGLAGPGAPTADSILADALQGRIEALWVFGHDLAALIGESELEALSRKVDLLIYSGTNDNRTAAAAHWVLPTAAYLEKDGTFVNCHGRVQRIGRAFPPLAGLAGRLDAAAGHRAAARSPARLAQSPGDLLLRWRRPSPRSRV